MGDDLGFVPTASAATQQLQPMIPRNQHALLRGQLAKLGMRSTKVCQVLQ
jgi:hypothetical protein